MLYRHSRSPGGVDHCFSLSLFQLHREYRVSLYSFFSEIYTFTRGYAVIVAKKCDIFFVKTDLCNRHIIYTLYIMK